MKCNRYPNEVNKEESPPQFIYQMCVSNTVTLTVQLLILSLSTYFLQNLCDEAFIE